jgi:hypothetical protein
MPQKSNGELCSCFPAASTALSRIYVAKRGVEQTPYTTTASLHHEAAKQKVIDLDGLLSGYAGK